MKPQAMQRIQSRLVLEKIAEAENIQIADERLDEEIAKWQRCTRWKQTVKELMGDYEKSR